MTQTLKQHYLDTIRPKLKVQLGLKNIQAVPALEKITINTGSSEFKTDREFLAKTKAWMAGITGQNPVETKAKKAIAAFTLREGDIVGLKVTLRGVRAYDFFQKLVTVVLPKLRDFQGVKRDSFDSLGNYTIGLKEQTVFPEVEYDKIGKIQGLEITISTSGKDKAASFALLEALGMPFTKD
ncbi:50S ribosomal protein L5 [Candidatus Collierbacteria bacterium]|nr:50S ribosomal protein L5 [Candidatus Collierbacteria bacterium]